MSVKKKILLSICIVAAVVVAFFAGAFVGCEICGTKGKKSYRQKSITFFSTKKQLGKAILKDEKNAVKIFTATYRECIQDNLDQQEKAIVKNIQAEVLNMSKDNTKITFKLKDLQSYNNNANNSNTAVAKVRKCQKMAYKHMTKHDKRLFKTALSKMSIKDVISVYNGIR